MSEQDDKNPISVRICSDGFVNTYDQYGVKVVDLCGDLTMLHKIVKIVRMRAENKAKLSKDLRLRSVQFYFMREDTTEHIELPLAHVRAFIRKVEGKENVDTFIEELIINSLNSED